MSSIATPKRASVRAASWAGHAPDRAQQHALKKQAILRAAALAFREAGYHETSLDDIARRLNVTKPTLYYYVRSKEDILLGCQETGFDQIFGYLDEVEASGLSGREMLRRAMIRIGEWVTSEFGTCVAQQWNVRVSPPTRARLDEARHALQAGVRRILERGRRDGSLPGVDASAAAAALFGAFNWLAFWYAAGPGRSSPGELGERFMRVFIDGLGGHDGDAAHGRAAVATRPSAKKTHASTRNR